MNEDNLFNDILADIDEEPIEHLLAYMADKPDGLTCNEILMCLSGKDRFRRHLRIIDTAIQAGLIDVIPNSVQCRYQSMAFVDQEARIQYVVDWFKCNGCGLPYSYPLNGHGSCMYITNYWCRRAVAAGLVELVQVAETEPEYRLVEP